MAIGWRGDNIFNISKINKDVKSTGGAVPRFRRTNEYLGQAYFDYLCEKRDLVILMDESHRYRDDAGITAMSISDCFGKSLCHDQS